MTQNIAPSQPRPSLHRTIFKNTAFVMIGSAILKVINFIFNVYIVSKLGDERFGQYSVVLAFVGMLQIFAELGISQYAMREIAKDRGKTQSLFFNVLALRMLLALAAIVWIPVTAQIAGYSLELVQGIFLFACTFLLAAIEAPLEMVLTAYERFDYVTGMTIIAQIGFVVFGSIFLLSGLGYLWLIVASLLSMLPQIGLGVWAVWRHHLLRAKVDFSRLLWPRIIRAGLPFGLISLTIAITFNFDSVLIKYFHSDIMVGWYRVAYQLVFTIMFISRGFKEAIVPSLARTYVHDPIQVERWYYRTTKVLLMLSLPITVGVMVLAHPITSFLYPKEFLPSVVALQIIIWDVPFLMFSGFCGNMSTVINQERAAARIYLINALANIGLNLIFIPRYGYIAASVITVITDLIGSIQFYFLLGRLLKLPNIRSIFWRVSLAVGVMGVVVWLINGSKWVIPASSFTRANRLASGLQMFGLVLIGALVYSAMVLILRLLDETEWGLIRRALGKLSGAVLPLKDVDAAE